MNLLKSKPKKFSDVYKMLKDLNQKSIKSLGENPELSTDFKKYFVFPHIEEYGFDTWQKIYDEIVLIIDKKSTQPKAVRDSLITMYHQVITKTKELNG